MGDYTLSPFVERMPKGRLRDHLEHTRFCECCDTGVADHVRIQPNGDALALCVPCDVKHRYRVLASYGR